MSHPDALSRDELVLAVQDLLKVNAEQQARITQLEAEIARLRASLQGAQLVHVLADGLLIRLGLEVLRLSQFSAPVCPSGHRPARGGGVSGAVPQTQYRRLRVVQRLRRAAIVGQWLGLGLPVVAGIRKDLEGPLSFMHVK